MNVAINQYTLRELDEPIAETTERVIDAGYDGIQYSGGLDGLDAALADRLEAAGARAVPPHLSLDLLESDLDPVVELCERFGVDSVVVPWAALDLFESRERVETFADRLAAVDDALGEHGLGLQFHNHHQEFQAVEDGALGLEIFAERTDMDFELDVGWVLAGGEDPVEWLDRLGDRCTQVHMKDVRLEEWGELPHPGRPVEIGTGAVDMQACADAAADIGADWLVYEHDVPEDPLASLAHGVDFLKSL
ncbi:sugar phosphate isomerase/epimerase family protein [Haloarchaeobius sp. DYHT-AS-18]|uniref:sugar phosphate isomerase/epimerase family protein n=1 Tax=Haloarchaeobius sp. DYHT-AS-18 TaxID=3446117 RepID=UPI003EC051D9